MSNDSTRRTSANKGKQKKVARKAVKLSLTTADDRRRIQQEVDQPYKSIGNWNASETFQLFSETELEHAAMVLGEDSRGGYFTGLYILILEHLGKLAFEKRFQDLEFAVSQVTQVMLSADHYAQQEGERLRDNTRERLAESATWLLSTRAVALNEKLQKHIEDVDEKARARKESAAA